jgi:hypothetical protein
MSGTTANRAIPYPTAADALSAFPALMQSAMNNLDVHTHPYMTAGSGGAPFRMNAGTAQTTSGTAATATATVTYTASRFTAAPVLMVTVRNSSLYVAGVTANSSSSATVQVRKSSGANFTAGELVDLSWVAVQMLTGSGAG